MKPEPLNHSYTYISEIGDKNMKSNNEGSLREAYIPLAIGFSLLIYSFNGDMDYLKRAITTFINSIFTRK
jgi:hypothetical protein